MLDAGDIVSRLLLDMKDFRKAMKAAPVIAEKDLKKLDRSMKKTMTSMSASQKKFVDDSEKAGKKFEKSWWDRFGRVAVGFTIAYRAMRVFQRGIEALIGTFTKGIKAIDDFRTAVIRTAAALSMLSKEPSTEALQIYLAFAKDTFEELEVVAARHFATADDLREAYSKFAVMRLVPTGPEELEAMASLVDWILIAEEALGRTLQIRTEIESVIEGTLRRGAVMARMANQVIGDYQEQVDLIEQTASSTEKSKIFFEMMAPLLDSISNYSEEILKTHMAWKANIDAIFKKIWRLGLLDAYEDLLGVMRRISSALLDQGELTEMGVKVAKAYFTTWTAIWGIVSQVLFLMKDMSRVLFPVLFTLKGIAAAFMMVVYSLRQAVAAVSGDLEKIATLEEERWDLVDKLFLSTEEFRKRYLEGASEDLAGLAEVLSKLGTMMGDMPEEEVKALEKWLDTIEKLEVKYLILRKTLKSLQGQAFDAEYAKNVEWQVKTAVEMLKVPEKLRDRYMAVAVALKAVNAEMVRLNAEAAVFLEAGNLRRAAEITEMLIKSLEEGKLKVEDLDKAKKMLELEVEYLKKLNAAGAEAAKQWRESALAQMEAQERLEDIVTVAEQVAAISEELHKSGERWWKSLEKAAEKWRELVQTPFDKQAAMRMEAHELWELELIDDQLLKQIMIFVEGLEEAGETFYDKISAVADYLGSKLVLIVQIIERLIQMPARTFDALGSLFDTIATWPEMLMDAMLKAIAKLMVMLPRLVESFKKTVRMEEVGEEVRALAGMETAADKTERKRREEERRQEIIDMGEALKNALVSGLAEANRAQVAILKGIWEDLPGLFSTTGIFAGAGTAGPLNQMVLALVGGIEEAFKAPASLHDIAALQASLDDTIAQIFEMEIAGTEAFAMLSEKAQYAIEWFTTSSSEYAKLTGEAFLEFYQVWMQFVDLWDDIQYEVSDMLGLLTPLEKQMIAVDKRFDDWIESMTALGASQETLTKIEGWRAAALAELIIQEKAALKESLEKRYLKLTLDPVEFSVWGLMRQFEDIIEQIREWTDLSSTSFEEMLSLAKETFRLEIKEAIKRSDAYTALEKSYNAWEKVVEDLSDQILALRVGMENPMNVLERMAILEAEIARVIGEDWARGVFDLAGLAPDDISEIQDLLAQYLTLAAEAFQRPATEYQTIFTDVLDALDALLVSAAAESGLVDIQMAQLLDLDSITSALSETGWLATMFGDAGIAGTLDQIATDIMAGIPVDVTGTLGDITVTAPTVTIPAITIPTLDITPVATAVETSISSLYSLTNKLLGNSNVNILMLGHIVAAITGRAHTIYGYKPFGLQAEGGGIFSGPMTGYPITAHGIEGVVPLERGAIPVRLESGAGDSIELNLTVHVDGSGSPKETAIEIERRLTKFLKGDTAREIIKTSSKGK